MKYIKFNIKCFIFKTMLIFIYYIIILLIICKVKQFHYLLYMDEKICNYQNIQLYQCIN